MASEATPYLAKITIIKVFPCRGEYVFRDLDARGGRKLQTDTHARTHTHTHTRDNNNEHNTNTNRRGHNFIGVAMQPEAATLAVSQERKSFTTNHTSILKIVRFNAQNVAQFDA